MSYASSEVIQLIFVFSFFSFVSFPFYLLFSVAAAILGTYTTLIVLWRVKAAISNKPKEPEVTEEAVTA